MKNTILVATLLAISSYANAVSAPALPVVSTTCKLGAGNSLTLNFGGPISLSMPKAHLTWASETYPANPTKIPGVQVTYTFGISTVSTDIGNSQTQFTTAITIDSGSLNLFDGQSAKTFGDVTCIETHGFMAWKE